MHREEGPLEDSQDGTLEPSGDKGSHDSSGDSDPLPCAPSSSFGHRLPASRSWGPEAPLGERIVNQFRRSHTLLPRRSNTTATAPLGIRTPALDTVQADMELVTKQELLLMWKASELRLMRQMDSLKHENDVLIQRLNSASATHTTVITHPPPFAQTTNVRLHVPTTSIDTSLEHDSTPPPQLRWRQENVAYI